MSVLPVVGMARHRVTLYMMRSWNDEAMAMNRARTLALLTESKSILAKRYGVTSLALFGSAARDSARESSDIDILVAFDGPATAERYFGVLFYLEDLLDRSVDLITENALRAELRPFVEQDARYV
jgi:predicted nucleotidyltransferase